MQAGQVWTEERITFLQKKWEEGLSFSDIAAGLSESEGILLTRNAVIGKAGRMGLLGKRRTVVLKHSPKPRAPRTDTRINVRSLFKPKPEPFVPKLVCIAAEPLHLSLYDLQPESCRFPFGDGPFTFCGHPNDGGPYCAAHHQATSYQVMR